MFVGRRGFSRALEARQNAGLSPEIDRGFYRSSLGRKESCTGIFIYQRGQPSAQSGAQGNEERPRSVLELPRGSGVPYNQRRDLRGL